MTLRTESRNRIGSNVDEVWAYVCEVGRAKPILGLSRGRSQEVTAVEAPHSVSFAGPIQRVSDREMAAIKAAVKPSTRGCVEL